MELPNDYVYAFTTLPDPPLPTTCRADSLNCITILQQHIICTNTQVYIPLDKIAQYKTCTHHRP